MRPWRHSTGSRVLEVGPPLPLSFLPPSLLSKLLILLAHRTRQLGKTGRQGGACSAFEEEPAIQPEAEAPPLNSYIHRLRGGLSSGALMRPRGRPCSTQVPVSAIPATSPAGSQNCDSHLLTFPSAKFCSFSPDIPGFPENIKLTPSLPLLHRSLHHSGLQTLAYPVTSPEVFVKCLPTIKTRSLTSDQDHRDTCPPLTQVHVPSLRPL